MKCALTGHRALGINFDRTTLEQELKRLIKSGVDTFYCGMALGFDIIACQILLEMRKKYKIRIVACIPCPEQDIRFNDEEKKAYRSAVADCDERVVISMTYTGDCMKKRNYYMVDNADFVYAYYNNNRRSGTYQTMNYAKKIGKKIYLYGGGEWNG